ncbi:hypothetical protein GOODEAATRI_004093 [Goodea atripinnis]|uniref:Uncharacterized protein n=1 Tax=Goodea atripinnis TaxID=208336 RepID=A0ABV0NHC4_9TELE
MELCKCLHRSKWHFGGLFVTSAADRIPASDVSTNSSAHPTPIKLEEMQQLNSSKDTRESGNFQGYKEAKNSANIPRLTLNLYTTRRPRNICFVAYLDLRCEFVNQWGCLL